METKKDLQRTEENNYFIKGLENIAKSSFDDDEALLSKWWSRKYNLPTNHPLLLNRHLEDLFIEYMQDELISKKQEKEEKKEDIGWENEIDKKHDFKMKKLISKKQGEIDISSFQEKAKKIEQFEDEIDEEFK